MLPGLAALAHLFQELFELLTQRLLVLPQFAELVRIAGLLRLLLLRIARLLRIALRYLLLRIAGRRRIGRAARRRPADPCRGLRMLRP